MERSERKFHRYSRSMGGILEKYIDSGTITEADRDLIQEYVSECESSRNIGEARRHKIVSSLANWRRFLLTPYRDLTLNEIYASISRLKDFRKENGERYTQNTLHDFVINLKPFIFWLDENNYNRINVEKVRKIRAPSIDMDVTPPEGILSVDEISLLIGACIAPRDKALLFLLYESGCRVGELARMTWKDLVFDKWGIKAYLHDTKTGKIRYSRLVAAKDCVLAWKNIYPGTPAGDASVFVTRGGQPIIDVTVDRILKRAAERSGITKRIYPHLFRKSRATHMVSQGYQESTIKASLWGNLNTDMFRIYVQLAEKDIDAEFLAQAGLVTKEESQSTALKPAVCSRCHTLNGPGINYCSNCGLGLTEEAAAEEGELDVVSSRRAKDMIDYLQKLIDSGDLPQPE